MNHRPLRIQFVLTSLPVGGAETLLLNLVKRLDRTNFQAEVVCLKEVGALGADFEQVVQLHSNLIRNKWDAGVLFRLKRLFQSRHTDAVITIGAGDKMFWGRLAAKLARVPVICSALHSTGWPDGVGRLNRWLTPLTDGFIAVASEHAQFMREVEKFPAERIFTIPNGVDTNRFRPEPEHKTWLRNQLGIDQAAKLVGIVAALREEKNHQQFIDAAQKVYAVHPDVHFVIVGDGPQRSAIERAIEKTVCPARFHLLGTRSDTERIVAALDVFCLTSRNEANPVSILEALSCGVPVVSPDVGSIRETVRPNQTGFLTKPLCAIETSLCVNKLLANPDLAQQLGARGRALVATSWSLEAMVEGYQSLIENLYNRRAIGNGQGRWIRTGCSDKSEATDTVKLPAAALVSKGFTLSGTSSSAHG